MAEREQVLQRFVRGSDNLEQGTGLGLAIVKEICEQQSLELELGDNTGAASGLRVIIQGVSH